jgi:hypothetical protein
LLDVSPNRNIDISPNSLRIADITFSNALLILLIFIVFSFICPSDESFRPLKKADAFNMIDLRHLAPGRTVDFDNVKAEAPAVGVFPPPGVACPAQIAQFAFIDAAHPALPFRSACMLLHLDKHHDVDLPVVGDDIDFKPAIVFARP